MRQKKVVDNQGFRGNVENPSPSAITLNPLEHCSEGFCIKKNVGLR